MNQPLPKRVFAGVVLSCLSTLPGIAAAQAHQTTISHATTPAPLSTEALLYPSAFGNYQPYADQPVQDWRKANATVNEVGGWRTYAKEIAEGQAIDKKDGASASNPHAGHHMNHPIGAQP